ncbi:MAG: hypothetical protein RL265_369 [Bacteroidota bacterium]
MSNRTIIVNKDFDPTILRTVLRRYWWWPVLFIVLFSTFAYFYLRYTMPVYESTMVFQLGNEDAAKEIIDIENINSRDVDISSEIELMRSQLIFEKAIQKINYSVSIFSKGQILTEQKYNSSSFNVQPYALRDSSLIGKPIFVNFNGGIITLSYLSKGKKQTIIGKLNDHLLNKDFDIVLKAKSEKHLEEDANGNQLYFVFNSIQSYAAQYLGSLQIAPIDPIAKTIQITFRGNNPEQCYDMTNAVAEAFNEFDKENKRQGSDNILRFIDQQMDSLSGALKNSKDSLIIYQRKANISNPENIDESISGSISDLQEKLTVLEEEIRSLNNVSLKLKSDPNRLEVYRLLPEMLGKSYEQSLSTQINLLHELLERKEDLLYRVTSENSEVKSINTKIQLKLISIRKSISVILDRLNENNKIIRAKLAGFENQYFELPEKKIEFSRLRNIQDLNEKYYSLLSEKKAQYLISDAGYTSNNRILSKPAINYDPFSPNKGLIYSSFIGFGFLLGLGVIIFRYLTFNEINQLEDLKKLLPAKASILGVIPIFLKGNMPFSQLVVKDASKSMLAESMRKIRVNLSYINPTYQTIAISSSISGEGKTFVALNLAGIIAMSGKKTILLDLDLRRPKIHLGLNADNIYGMSGLIVNQFTMEQCLKHSILENLDFISAGPIPPNPSELLLSNRFKEIVEELKKSYDVIILDNPPIGLVSDGIKVLTDADIPIYVFKSHYSKRNFALRVKELFDLEQLEKLNVVLNAVSPAKTSSYGYGYGFQYGYGYYEGEDVSRKEKIKNRLRDIIKRLFKNANK